MSVDTMYKLLEKVYNEVGFLTVKFPKSDKLFTYDGKVLSDNRIALYLQETGHLVQTSAKELLVQMNYRTYELHQLRSEEDYKLALALFEYYINQTLLKEGLRFVYLLRLTIEDYERQHYPIASLSTVDFIDYLLEERGLSWYDLTLYVFNVAVSEEYAKELLQPDNISVNDVIKLSHFFRLPVQAFIIGGYNA